MIHRFLSLAAIIACSVFFSDIPFGFAGEPEIITLWPGTAPGEGSEIPTEGEFTEGGKKFVAQKPIYLVTLLPTFPSPSSQSIDLILLTIPVLRSLFVLVAGIDCWRMISKGPKSPNGSIRLALLA